MDETTYEQSCDVCGGAVEIDELFCGTCGVKIEGREIAAVCLGVRASAQGNGALDGSEETHILTGTPAQCPQCMSPLDADEAFCGKCGARVTALAPVHTVTVRRAPRVVLTPEDLLGTDAQDGDVYGGVGQSLMVAMLASVVFAVGLRLTTMVVGLVETNPELGSIDWPGLVLSLVGWLVPFSLVAVVLAVTGTARTSVLWLTLLVSLACFAVLVGGLVVYLVNLTLASASLLPWVFNIAGMLAAFVPFGIVVAVAGNTVLPRWAPVVSSAAVAIVTGVAARWLASGWVRIDLDGLTFVEGDWAAVLREYAFLTLMTFTLFALFQLRWKVTPAPAGTGAIPRPGSLGTAGVAIAAAAIGVVALGVGLLAKAQSDAYAEAAGRRSGDYLWSDEDAYGDEAGYGTYDDSGSSGGYDGSSSSDLSAPTTAAAPAQPIRPVSAVATAERSSYHLRCTGEYVTYGASRLIDGDMNTGWGAGENDGTGVSVTVRLGGRVRLTRVGLTPGFAKYGPRQDQGCSSVEAFAYNRFVSSVRYTFDNGTSIVQNFEQRKDMQYVPVDVVTQSVTITILATEQPYGADDDTVLSEVAFEGRPA